MNAQLYTSRDRVGSALKHQEPDRVPVDFGGTAVTGIHVSAVTRLRQLLLGENDWRVRVIEPYQMLGEIDDKLRIALGIDVVGVPPRRSMFGTEATRWKPFKLFDGTECLVPGDFNVAPAPDGGWLIYPEGDTSVPPSGHMPQGGYFFDAIIRQDPIEEEKLKPEDNAQEFGILGEADLAYYRGKKEWLQAHPECGCILTIPGAAFGDIALVPAAWLKHPKGIRDVAEWYVSTKIRRDYVYAVFERQCAIALKNIETLIDLFGDLVQAAFVTGTDFGTQRGPFISLQSYRDLFKPFHQQVTALMHRRSNWKAFIHSCGSVYQLIPDFIEAGFDILNPVQCSAAEMDAGRLKREFGDSVVFWGGGVDTQKTMAFGKPDEVYREVRGRIETFNRGGGFVFNSVHNLQGNTPVENIEALFKAVNDSKKP
jgi:uroporphyrinogen decarboxylase-like protein